MPTRTAAKTAAKKGKTNVTTEADPLAELGLTETTTAAPSVAPETAETDIEVSSDEIEIGVAEFIPTAKRAGGGSMYPFDKLTAPVKDAASGKTKYSNFTVKVKPGQDPDKLKRSVQSATTQANKQGKSAGRYFVSRSTNDGSGKFASITVFRTDDPNSN